MFLPFCHIDNSQATKLDSHAEFPSAGASNGQILRHLYYTARLQVITTLCRMCRHVTVSLRCVQAIQLEYGAALQKLQQVLVSAP